jgi:hypothetical protein
LFEGSFNRIDPFSHVSGLHRSQGNGTEIADGACALGGCNRVIGSNRLNLLAKKFQYVLRRAQTERGRQLGLTRGLTITAAT